MRTIGQKGNDMLLDGISSFTYNQSLLRSSTSTGQKTTQTSSASVEFSVEIAVESVEPKQTTVDDVKKEFAAFLDSLQITQLGTAISVCVSDSAWEKMAADPEYKQKMMDLCKRDLCDPAWETKVPSPAVTTIRIDADAEEEYLASGYGSAVTHMADTSNAFWENRTKKNKQYLEEMSERALEKRQMLEFIQERAVQRKGLLGESGVAGSATQVASKYFPTSATSGAASFFSSGGGFM
jgi:hypothetical protein